MVSGAKPLVILDETGGVLDVSQTDEKGFKKSIEHGSLWVRHADTERLLPYEPSGAASGFVDHGGWYEATLVRGNAVTGARGPAEAGSDAPAAHGAPAGHPGARETDGTGPGVFSRLYALIEGRKRELPEGSYTSYLFREGPDKIRKKTGEEAIELLLAAEHADQVHEAADLIYHLFVLLVEAGVGFDELANELASR